ncbi:hypothetical protein R50073_17940 [Maricurvus nonylphenolicus]|uniref:hypothetical protein n=1 Tax=Maricurvus nonylphenolicus TaxID=1008307 RepID=UPI0036F3F490
MKKIIENLLALLQELPNILQILFYGGAIIILTGLYFKLFPGADINEKAYTNLMSARPDDSLITSSGSSGNYIFITPDKDNNLTYWPNLKDFMTLVRKEKGGFKSTPYTDQMKKGTYCGFQLDFKFGYSDRLSIQNWFLGLGGENLRLPKVFGLYESDSQEFTLSKSAKGGTLCQEYLYGVSGAEVTTTLIDSDKACIANGNDSVCSRTRMANWLDRDGILKEHLERGITAAAVSTMGQIKRCKQIQSINSGSLPDFCSAYLGSPLIDNELKVIKQRQKALAALDELDLKACYNPISGEISCAVDALAASPISKPHTGKSPSLFNKAWASNTGSLDTFNAEIGNTTFMQTFSTLVTLTASKQQWIAFEDDEIAIRRDVSRVYYGTTLPTINDIGETITVNNKRVFQITLAEPDILAIDRWATDFAILHDGVIEELLKPGVTNEKGISGYLNEKSLESLKDAIAVSRISAITNSNQILSDRYTTVDGIVNLKKNSQTSSDKPFALFANKALQLFSH